MQKVFEKLFTGQLPPSQAVQAYSQMLSLFTEKAGPQKRDQVLKDVD
jgi:hypothetical protein